MATDYDNTIEDFERGCKFLKPNSTYLTADVSAFAHPDAPPAFVTFSRPIPYREGHFRTFKRINGTEFLLDATQHVSEIPEDESVAHRERVRDDAPPATEIPEGEVLDYIERVRDDDADLPDFGSSPFLSAMNVSDLLMHVGGSYYAHPEDFIDEARRLGVNKKVPTSGNQEPPRVRSGRTRMFIIHPHAIPTGKDAFGNDLTFDPDDADVLRRVDEEGDFPFEVADDDAEDDEKAAWFDQRFIPGIVGYAYLTRAIHTKDVDGGAPEHAREWEATRDDVDVVEIGERVTFEDPDHPMHEDDADKAAQDAESAPEAAGDLEAGKFPGDADEPPADADGREDLPVQPTGEIEGTYEGVLTYATDASQTTIERMIEDFADEGDFEAWAIFRQNDDAGGSDGVGEVHVKFLTSEAVAARRQAFEDSPLGFHDLRRVVSKNDLLRDVQHPGTDDLLDALARAPLVDVPEVSA